MTKALMDFFNRQPRLGTLSTAGKDGKVNAGFFGSPRMVDEQTIEMGIGKNRSLANLRENPHAVFLVMEPGKSLAEWKGVRIYVKMVDCQTTGEKLDGIKARIAEASGDKAARMMHAALTFTVEDVRPLVDVGQGWEKAI
ncbi:MAG: pyridoxamine 5'-phosphate oxidase family protein [Thermodesulfobacteriota bacterium]